MSRKLAQKGRKLVAFIAIYQCITALLISAILAGTYALDASLSFLVGSATAIIPALVMGLFTFRYVGGNKNKLVLKSFNTGNKMKFLLTLVLIIASITQPFMVFEMFLAGLAVTYVIQWIAIWRHQE